MLRIVNIFFVLIVGCVNLLYAQNSDQVKLDRWLSGEKVSRESVEQFGEANCFVALEIDDAIFDRIYGKSFKEECTLDRDDLRYIKLLHVDCNMEICLGEIVCHRAISRDIIEIFTILYHGGYPIERMVLVDEYGANDARSMAANNSSSFNFRRIAGSQTLSKHSMGLAIDINPVQNPYVKRLSNGSLKVDPIEGSDYVDREVDHPYMIKYGDLCYREFVKRGFVWGGNWRSVKDYQHFEKSL